MCAFNHPPKLNIDSSKKKKKKKEKEKEKIVARFLKTITVEMISYIYLKYFVDENRKHKFED